MKNSQFKQLLKTELSRLENISKVDTGLHLSWYTNHNRSAIILNKRKGNSGRSFIKILGMFLF